MRVTYGSLDLTAAPFGIVFGSDFGAPENIVEALAFLLQDGEIELSPRASNRTLTLPLLIEGDDLTELAEKEALLVRESEKPLNTLVIEPPSAPASVFETFRGQVTFSRNDSAEQQNLRQYTMTIRAFPFARSQAEVVAEAIGSGSMTSIPEPINETIDDGSSASDWSASWTRTTFFDGSSSGSATPSVEGGAVTASTPSFSSTFFQSMTETITLTWTGSEDVSASKQLVVRWRWDETGSSNHRRRPREVWEADGFTAKANGTTALTLLSGSPTPARGATAELTFLIPPSITSLTSLTLEASLSSPMSGGPFESTSRSLSIAHVSRNNFNASVSTPRQLQRVVDVTGSAPTQGRIAIEHTVNALGYVSAYFWPNIPADYSPPMRQFRDSGGAVSADTSLISGAYENLVGNTTVFLIPAARIPRGGYLLEVALGGANTTATITWTATTLINSVDVGPTYTGTVTRTITTAYAIYPLTRIPVLPTRDLGSPTDKAEVKVTLSATVSGGSTANLDEAWLYNMDIGQLVRVNCGTGSPTKGGAANRMHILPATTTTPRPTIRIGYDADGSDFRFPGAVYAWQPPRFVPPRTNVLTVTSNALDAAVTLYHYPHWHTHAAI